MWCACVCVFVVCGCVCVRSCCQRSPKSCSKSPQASIRHFSTPLISLYSCPWLGGLTCQLDREARDRACTRLSQRPSVPIVYVQPELPTTTSRSTCAGPPRTTCATSCMRCGHSSKQRWRRFVCCLFYISFQVLVDVCCHVFGSRLDSLARMMEW